MARKQTRRTISVSARLLGQLRAYADERGLAVSALTEFVLEQQLATRLNEAAFDDWYAARRDRITALQRAAGAATTNRIPWAQRPDAGVPR